MSKSNIVEVFGKFAVELADGPQMFDTREEAVLAETEFLKGAEFRAKAAGYCQYKGLEGKNAKGKTNVVVDFLSWVEAGRPEAPAKEEVEAEEEAAAEEVEEAVTTEEVTEEVVF